jgi:hypothetical protein
LKWFVASTSILGITTFASGALFRIVYQQYQLAVLGARLGTTIRNISAAHNECRPSSFNACTSTTREIAMSTSFSVRVVNDDGDPVEGIDVAASFGVLHGMLEASTSDDGWAEFEASGDYVSVKLFVDGSSVGEHGLSEGDTFTFTL